MEQKPVYLDVKRPIEKRVNDLLKRMTIDEKIDQMFTTGCNELEPIWEKIQKGEMQSISATFVYHGFNPETYNRLQRHQVENTRLGIPLMLACENTHGLSNPLATIFPTTGCMAATFDEKLIGKFAKASAKEARILGITQLYAPNVDISWDLRWGRVEENFGEDPYLTSKMATEIVKNFQSEGVCATVKHYIAYGLGEGGLNIAPAHIGEREVREYMLPAFEMCIKKGGAWSIMPSYNEVDGIPVHSSKLWMKDVLRGELGFDGMVMTDYGASNMFASLHHIIDEPKEAGRILCDNEVDMEGCGYFGYCDKFREEVKAGKYPISRIDRCVKNVLRLKFRLGLFENPYAQIEKIPTIHNENNVALAREIAEKGIVLLKNDGVLPLKETQKVALIGPNADISQLGNYIYYGYFDKKSRESCVAEESLSLKAVFESQKEKFLFAKGSEFEKTNETLLNEAFETAKAADVVVLALGSNSKGGTYGGNQDGENVSASKRAVTSGEGFDLNSIELTPAQKVLFDTVYKAGKPIVMLLYGGRPYAITEQLGKTSAVLFGFGVGEQGNQAMFDILYGKVNPSGKLPLSFPRSTGHLPCFYNYKPSARGNIYKAPGTPEKPGYDYVFDTPAALFPFGYGLSYTQFAYENLQVEKLGKHNFKVSVDVQNIGDMDGEESVLLFLSQKTQRVTPMVKKLRAFKRIALQKGERKTVSFKLGKDDFSFVDVDMKRRVAKSECRIMIADLKQSVIVE